MKNYTEELLPKGSDKKFKLQLFDASGALDLTGFSNIVVILYYKDKAILQKYSKTAAAGWSELTVGGTGNNELSFTLQTAETNLAKNTIVFYEIRTQKADATVSDGKYDTIINDEYLCTITDSISSTLTLP